MSEFVSIKDIAQRASLSEKTVRRLISRGLIPHYRPSPRGKMLVGWTEFERWFESRRVTVAGDGDAREILEPLFAKRTA